MTGFLRLVMCAFGLLLIAGPSMASFNVQEAKKTCATRYDREKEGGTLPAGMPKSKYMSQCVNGMRRDAELEKSLTSGGGETPSAAPAAGSNELSISTKPTATPPTATTQAKPAAVPTPALTASKGSSSR